jgi:hypothetical protein
MSIKVPWPDDLSPEEISRREKERDERISKLKEQRRREFEAAVAERDVATMAPLALAAMGRMTDASLGISARDIEDLGRLATELAIEGRPLRLGGFRKLLALSTVLKVKGEELRGTVPDRVFKQLIAAASYEISELVVNSQAAARQRGEAMPEAQGSDLGGHPPSRSSSQAIDPEAKVTLKMIEAETGIPYSTLTSRRLRLAGSKRPQPIGKHDGRSSLYRRGDWDEIISNIWQQKGISDSAEASDA